MLVEQLVTTVTDRRVEVKGLTPHLDQDLMYRLMNLAPSYSDLEDHQLSAYLYFCSENRDAVFGRTYYKEASAQSSSTQSNFIVSNTDNLAKFRNNPALFTFNACAEGLLHDKDQHCPQMPELDFRSGESRFEPVFENKRFQLLAEATIQEIEKHGRAAVLGISKPFRFLIPFLSMMDEDTRIELNYSINSRYLPKDEILNLLVFPSISSSLLQHLEDSGIGTLSLGDSPVKSCE